MKRWTLSDLIKGQVFGIVNKVPFSDDELEPVLTIEYELDSENDSPAAWLRSESYRQRFSYPHIRTIMRVFRGQTLYLSPLSPKAGAHGLVLLTSHHTYGFLCGIREPEEEARS